MVSNRDEEKVNKTTQDEELKAASLNNSSQGRVFWVHDLTAKQSIIENDTNGDLLKPVRSRNKRKAERRKRLARANAEMVMHKATPSMSRTTLTNLGINDAKPINKDALLIILEHETTIVELKNDCSPNQQYKTKGKPKNKKTLSKKLKRTKARLEKATRKKDNRLAVWNKEK